jgi:subtilase family serine protease
MTRNRLPLTITALALGLAGLLGVSACGTTTAAHSAPAAEDLALQSAGFQTVAGAAVTPSATTSAPSSAPGADKQKRRGIARRILRKRTLHGEVTVTTKKGVKTVLVQRGTVTAVSATTVTVKSADGFSQTWTFGDKVRVAKKKQVSDIKAGSGVGVAGADLAGKATARLIVLTA